MSELREVLAVTNLKVGHRDKKKKELLVEGLTLNVREGDVIALVGKSSTGKTTLLRVLAGFDQPVGGEVHFEGQPVTEAYGTGRLQYLHQLPVIWEQLTVRQAIKTTAELLRLEQGLQIDELIETMGLQNHAHEHGYKLSPGGRARLALARAFCSSPSLLLMDEPFASVDYLNRSNIAQQLSSFIRQRNAAAVWITHDLTEALRFSTHILVLHEDRATFDLFDNPRADDAHVDPNKMSAELLEVRNMILDCFAGADA